MVPHRSPAGHEVPTLLRVLEPFVFVTGISYNAATIVFLVQRRRRPDSGPVA
jgi:hypothetical protein